MDSDPWIPPPLITGLFPGLVSGLSGKPNDPADAFFELTEIQSIQCSNGITRSRKVLREGMAVQRLENGRKTFESEPGRDVEGFTSRLIGGKPNKKNTSDAAPVLISAKRYLDLPQSIREKTMLLLMVEETARSVERDVASVDIWWQQEDRRTCLFTSSNKRFLGRTEHATIKVRVTLRTGEQGEAIEGYPDMHSPQADDFLERAARTAVEQAVHQRESRGMEGAFPVLFGPGWGGVWMHEVLGHLLEADVFANGPFANQMGRPIAPDFVDVYDDPGIEGSPASFFYDDEGHKAERVALVKNGILQGLIKNRRRASYRQAPLPRMSNLVLMPGEHPALELLEGMKRGIYVVLPGSAFLNPQLSHWVVDVVEGYHVDAGEITSPISEVRIRGKVSDLLTNLAAIGSDFKLETTRGLCEKAGQVISTGVGQPSVLFRDLWVGKR